MIDKQVLPLLLLLSVSCSPPVSPLGPWLDSLGSAVSVDFQPIDLVSPDGYPVVVTSALLRKNGSLLVADGASGTIVECLEGKPRCKDLGAPILRPSAPLGLAEPSEGTVVAWTRTKMIRLSLGARATSTVLKDSLDLRRPTFAAEGLLDFPWGTTLGKPTAFAPDARGDPLLRYTWGGNSVDTVAWVAPAESTWTVTSGAVNRLEVVGTAQGGVLVVRDATAEVAWAGPAGMGPWTRMFQGARDARGPALIEDPISRQMLVDEHPLIDNAALAGGRLLIVVANREMALVRAHWYAPRLYKLESKQVLLFLDAEKHWAVCALSELPAGRWKVLGSDRSDQVPLLHQSTRPGGGISLLLARLPRPSTCAR